MTLDLDKQRLELERAYRRDTAIAITIAVICAGMAAAAAAALLIRSEETCR